MHVITVTGIRPDFIRMSAVFEKLDAHPDVRHTLVHTGQHYDPKLSHDCFAELDIRDPDFNLGVGGPGKEHFHQTAELSVKLIELIRTQEWHPDWIIFLGDSNSVLSAVALKKEGYRIAHIEAGMRSYDRRMLEEINRIVCDHVSDVLFVYHPNYRAKLVKEGIREDKILVTGNTIVEVVRPVAQKLFIIPKRREEILVDIHRPENFQSSERLRGILWFVEQLSAHYGIPARWIVFPRCADAMRRFHITWPTTVKPIDLLSFKQYLERSYHAAVLVSDSGTAQEEPALLRTPVCVPREFTERPESVDNGCSFMIPLPADAQIVRHAVEFVDTFDPDTAWLGDGHAADTIVSTIVSGPTVASQPIGMASIMDGQVFADDRGMLKSINDFDMSGVKRFYQVTNHEAGFVRAWHGHEREDKYAYVTRGTARVVLVPLDRFRVEDTKTYVMSAEKPQVLRIPAGFYNGFQSLTPDATLLFFSTSTLVESKGDDVRKPWDALGADIWDTKQFR